VLKQWMEFMAVTSLRENHLLASTFLMHQLTVEGRDIVAVAQP